MSLDRIALLGLRVVGRHGVFDFERADGQEFVIDAVLWVDTRPAAAADDLAATVDYGAVADRLADACLADERVRQTQITVHKPEAPVSQPVQDVTVTIRRSRP